MPAKSEAQRRLMAIAEHHPEKVFARNRGVLGMSKSKLHEFARTKEKGLPGHKRGSGGGGSSPVKFEKREGGTDRD